MYLTCWSFNYNALSIWSTKGMWAYNAHLQLYIHLQLLGGTMNYLIRLAIANHEVL